MKKNANNHLYPQGLMTIGLFIFTGLITGCASSPQHMVIAPQLMLSNSNLYQAKSAQVSVNDLRNKVHIIEIFKEDAAAKLINSDTDLSQVINEHFSQALKQSGLNIDDYSANNITLFINSADIKVKQALMKYTTTGQLTLTAKIASGEQVLTKTYQSKMNSEGVLTADLAVIERDFNQQLAKLLQQIVTDSEIQQFLK